MKMTWTKSGLCQGGGGVETKKISFSVWFIWACYQWKGRGGGNRISIAKFKIQFMKYSLSLSLAFPISGAFFFFLLFFAKQSHYTEHGEITTGWNLLNCFLSSFDESFILEKQISFLHALMWRVVQSHKRLSPVWIRRHAGMKQDRRKKKYCSVILVHIIVNDCIVMRQSSKKTKALENSLQCLSFTLNHPLFYQCKQTQHVFTSRGIGLLLSSM